MTAGRSRCQPPGRLGTLHGGRQPGRRSTAQTPVHSRTSCRTRGGRPRWDARRERNPRSGAARTGPYKDERVSETLRDDPTMARLVGRQGPVSVKPAEDEYRRPAVSSINQQLSTASATAVRERVFELLDEVTPTAVLGAEEAALREAGLSETKVDYLRSTARAFRDGDCSREGLAGLDDEIVVDRLTDIRGVGKWTAGTYLMFT